MDNKTKALDIAMSLIDCDLPTLEKCRKSAIQMAEWKDEQLKQQKQKLKEFENWLYNKQADWEELVGLYAAIQKFEELGL